MSRKQESLRQGTSAAREDQRPSVRLPGACHSRLLWSEEDEQPPVTCQL